MRISRKTAAIVTVVIALLIPTSASAGYWAWNGNLGVGTSGNCIFYTNRSVCSGWNYWNSISTDIDNGATRIHCGFQNNSAIRGTYAWGPYNVCQAYIGGTFGNGAYVRAGNTHFEGPTVFIRSQAFA